MVAVPICFMLERHEVCRAFSRAWAKTGKRMAARIAIMAMTTSSSISVKALGFLIALMLLSEMSERPSGEGRSKRSVIGDGESVGAITRERTNASTGVFARTGIISQSGVTFCQENGDIMTQFRAKRKFLTSKVRNFLVG